MHQPCSTALNGKAVPADSMQHMQEAYRDCKESLKREKQTQISIHTPKDTSASQELRHAQRCFHQAAPKQKEALQHENQTS